ncbi:uncharacterized protein LOC118184768 [Stegodyphus dumicola]|uniref:uncharacterized protein LOC118184768 n=1 Tax=Stegodyphus dumicola TaxID=202533 RepID=UPI0015AA1142|nr:uncharacterized protein LOC118184768 [Stegodyphus dumicola]
METYFAKLNLIDNSKWLESFRLNDIFSPSFVFNADFVCSVEFLLYCICFKERDNMTQEIIHLRNSLLTKDFYRTSWNCLSYWIKYYFSYLNEQSPNYTSVMLKELAIISLREISRSKICTALNDHIFEIRCLFLRNYNSHIALKDINVNCECRKQKLDDVSKCFCSCPQMYICNDVRKKTCKDVDKKFSKRQKRNTVAFKIVEDCKVIDDVETQLTCYDASSPIFIPVQSNILQEDDWAIDSERDSIKLLHHSKCNDDILNSYSRSMSYCIQKSLGYMVNDSNSDNKIILLTPATAPESNCRSRGQHQESTMGNFSDDLNSNRETESEKDLVGLLHQSKSTDSILGSYVKHMFYCGDESSDDSDNDSVLFTSQAKSKYSDKSFLHYQKSPIKYFSDEQVSSDDDSDVITHFVSADENSCRSVLQHQEFPMEHFREHLDSNHCKIKPQQDLNEPVQLNKNIYPILSTYAKSIFYCGDEPTDDSSSDNDSFSFSFPAKSGDSDKSFLQYQKLPIKYFNDENNSSDGDSTILHFVSDDEITSSEDESIKFSNSNENFQCEYIQHFDDGTKECFDKSRIKFLNNGYTDDYNESKSCFEGYINPCFDDDMLCSFGVPYYIQKINEEWNCMMQDIEGHPRQPSRVSFAPLPNLVTVHCIEQENNAQIDAFELDRIRFRHRINELNSKLAPFLSDSHRTKVLQRNISYT